MNTFMYAYNEHSESAKALSQAMGIKRIKHENSRFKSTRDKIVINWGSSELPNYVQWAGHRLTNVINHPDVVAICSNKLKLFDHIYNWGDDGIIPEWTTDIDTAKLWAIGWPNYKVVERHVLNGHSGQGIRIVTDQSDLQPAPLYVKYIPKRDEFRVHMIGGTIIDVQQKKKRLDFDEEVNYNIRNHAGGFIYARENLNVPDNVLNVAHMTYDTFVDQDLDIAAMDIIYNSKLDRAYLLEINTAPGLEGQTVQLYADALKELIG